MSVSCVNVTTSEGTVVCLQPSISIAAAITVMAAIGFLSLLLMTKSLTKSKELVKARLFLRYDRINRMVMVGCMLLMIGVVVHISYVLLTPSTWSIFVPVSNGFIPWGILLLAFYGAMTYIGITVSRMLRGI